MNEEERVDLSALDPMADPERWRAFVQATLARVDAVLVSRPKDPLSLIASWSKGLTATAVLVIALLIPIELMLEQREAGVERIQRLVQLSAETGQGERPPTGAELYQALGDGGLR